ncbi:PREDICTED: ATP phosphoribosyltransferase 2, chloroplastic isoform X1 [Theobroma cacao]|uniref:ATP phosphoribosyltransferase n=1 Tax=Theobroma cacao TaxID=3641 RepID=A0AB32VGB9_THECC|nr:PREDICTED: ATP phosphoribosyltransferase 2, chloroplastic isoform X1 [Theobroma cacao]
MSPLQPYFQQCLFSVSGPCPSLYISVSKRSFISCCSSQSQTAVVNGKLDSRIAERDEIRLGLPSKGRIAADTLDLLKDCQLSVKQVNPRQYVAQIPQLSNLGVWFQRPKDIVRKLLSGDLDLGIVGLDTVSEYGQQGNEDLIIVHDALEYGDCHLSLAIPKYGIFENINSLKELARMPQWTVEKPLRVATGFTYLGPKFMKENGLKHVIFSTADGALEAAPAMGIADAILDLVSSGTTLRENNLKEIEGGVVLESQAVLVASRKALIQRKGALDTTHEILERFEAHLRAIGQFMVTANMRGSSAEEVAERILSQPSLAGLQGPTVSPVFSKRDGKAVADCYATVICVPKKALYKSVQQLRAVGGSGVLISPLTYIFDEETPRWRELLSKLGL